MALRNNCSLTAEKRQYSAGQGSRAAGAKNRRQSRRKSCRPEQRGAYESSPERAIYQAFKIRPGGHHGIERTTHWRSTTTPTPRRLRTASICENSQRSYRPLTTSFHIRVNGVRQTLGGTCFDADLSRCIQVSLPTGDLFQAFKGLGTFANQEH